ncbi:MAG: antA/AntB antirepressor family protein [Halopseudomonas sp.]|uniref:antA/AntB antirepressor family protein n=1 Tax=Halopseudomonas sp. TaxID=2901191 RepID=UPI003000FBEA
MSNITVAPVESNNGMSFATLIPVKMGELNGDVAQLCNARDLHICLKVGRRFASWISDRINEYRFVEGVDFATQNGEAKKVGRGGHNRKEYSLSVDMAKELAMVERTDQGRAIRRYFIECEKKLRQIDPDSAALIMRRVLNPAQQHELSGKVHEKVALLPKGVQRSGYCELWSHLKSKHQVARYQDICQGEFEEACQFVDAYVWEGEWLGKEKPAAPKPPLNIHYPLDALTCRRPGMLSPYNDNHETLQVTLEDLSSPRTSFCEMILSELSRNGYAVEAAWWEFRTYRNKFEAFRGLVHNLGNTIEEPQNYVVNRNALPA